MVTEIEDYQERFKKELIKMIIDSEKLGTKASPKIKAGLTEMLEKDSEAPSLPPEKKKALHEMVSDNEKRGSW